MPCCSNSVNYKLSIVEIELKRRAISPSIMPLRAAQRSNAILNPLKSILEKKGCSSLIYKRKKKK